MQTQAEIAADRIAMKGGTAGETIWEAINAAIDIGMSAQKARRVFDLMMETLADELPAQESDLFISHAYEALPVSACSTVERSEINSNAWRAYDNYTRAILPELLADESDYRADIARDERVSA